MQVLDFTYGSKDVQDFLALYNEGRLNLEPGFQRKSVWSVNDRKKLILSLLENYPIPSIFLYKTTDEDGRHKYDVLDGKQRLESILMFFGAGTKFRTCKYEIVAKIEENEEIKVWNWNTLKKAKHEHRLTGYKIQTVEVSGELGDIIDLFVRINSTGKTLTSQEKRHAKFYHSAFLKKASQLGARYEGFLVDNNIVTKSQVDRMKHVELISELLASLHQQQLLNKKTTLDKIIGGQTINIKSLDICKAEFVRVINVVMKVFPNLYTTRLANSAEFYSLFMLIWKFDKEKMILSNKSRNLQAQKLLEWLSNGVDDLRIQISKAKGAKQDQQLFASYLFTTRGDSDSITTRKRREEVLTQLFAGIFEKKDENRGFSIEQRRFIWNSTATKSCTNCKEKLTWENFTIDHITPHALGGKSSVDNATLMCRSCNSRKGARV